MYKVLFIPLSLGYKTPEDTGFFHIVRDMALARELVRLAPETESIFIVPGLRANIVKSEGFNVIKSPPITFRSRIEDLHLYYDFLYSTIKKIEPSVIIGDMFSYPSLVADILSIPFVLVVDYIFPKDDINIFVRALGLRANLIIVCDTHPFWPIPSVLKAIENRVRFVGPILRPFNHLLEKSKREMKKELGFDPDDFLILVTMGGSGLFKEPFKVAIEAHKILRENIENVTIVLSLGIIPREEVTRGPLPEGLVILEYVKDLSPYIRASDVIVTRGGHGTLAEASVLGTPIIATNMPEMTRRLEDLCNIRRFRALGNTIFIPAYNFTPQKLAKCLTRILSDEELRNKMIRAGQRLPRDGRVKAAKLILNLLQKPDNFMR